MRRALDSFGGRTAPRAEQREPNPVTVRDRTGAPRRRFVRDGEVPVTVLRRDTPPGATLSSPLQQAETALANEIAARRNAERLLTEAQAQIRDLQTKLGHAELAKTEAADLARAERERAAELRTALGESEQSYHEIVDRLASLERHADDLNTTLLSERSARRKAEAMLVTADEERRSLQATIKELSQSSPAAPPRVARPVRRAAPHRPEPEPVKWWLLPEKATRRR